VAREARALSNQDLKRVTVDTTVQPMTITFPTDAKLLHAAIHGLSRLATQHGRQLRQSYRLSDRAHLRRQEYRGHDAQNPGRIFISRQKHGVFGIIRRELRHRSAIAPIIGHLKADGHLGVATSKAAPVMRPSGG